MAQTFNAGGSNRLQEVASFSTGPQKQFCSDMPRKLSLPRNNFIPLCKPSMFLRIGCEFLGRTLLKCRNQAFSLVCAVCSPKPGSIGEMAILRQLQMELTQSMRVVHAPPEMRR